jgi:hypothetical protein
MHPIRTAVWPALVLAVVAARPAAAADLALTRVVLSSGGVGQFEYEADVDGAATLSIPVPLDQVNDVLKSLRVDDPAGRPASVGLPGREPLAEAFRTLPFGQDALGSAEALLGALVGAEVRLPASGTGGTILAVAPFDAELPNNGGHVVRHRLTIVTPAGLDSVVLEDSPQIEIVSPALRTQIAGALAAMAANHAQDRRTLQVALAPGGHRHVTLTTVVAVPVWKASYRMVTPGPDASGSTRLEGWAVVENLSGQDWHDVDVTLTSGQPVLYRQALYDAIYAERPEAPVEVANRLTPRVDEGGVATAAAAPAPAPAPPPPAALAAPSARAFRASRPGASGGMAPSAPPDAEPEPPPAEAAQGATQVLFHLSAKVSAASGQSLLLPIVARDVKVRRVALYQPGTDATHPLVALELTNDTGAALPPGLVTLYETGAGGAQGYVGDARLPSVQAGETRLASFALDLPVHVDAADRHQSVTVDAHAARGVLQLSLRDRVVTTYRVAVPAGAARRLLIEVPRRPGYEVMQPGAADVVLTPTDWRIGRDLPAGQTTQFDVVIERPLTSAITLGDAGGEQLLALSTQGDIPERVRAALKPLAALRTEVDRKQQALRENTAQQATIISDQGRVRANLSAVPANSELQRNYLAQLAAQEKTLATLRTEQDELRRQAHAAEQAFKDAVAALNT